ncbi:hypothetical protein CRG98_047673 [Punica granatum]|uniref:Mitotic-spindle organizing protein 1B-like n=2 Tax=Punica granatum TaxID=22663 RepID=A0A2I0HJT4_PUNGR|nr:hypothetical protein CRG98_047673 [Punica granatum]
MTSPNNRLLGLMSVVTRAELERLISDSSESGSIEVRTSWLGNDLTPIEAIFTAQPISSTVFLLLHLPFSWRFQLCFPSILPIPSVYSRPVQFSHLLASSEFDLQHDFVLPLTCCSTEVESCIGTNMDPEAARTARESLDLAFHMSNILDTGLDRHTLSVLIALCDLGLNPEALAAVVKELRREPSVSVPATAPPSFP